MDAASKKEAEAARKKLSEVEKELVKIKEDNNKWKAVCIACAQQVE